MSKSPLSDQVLRRNGWKGRHNREHKPVDSPEVLFDTLPGDPGARSGFEARSRGSILWTRFRLLLPKG